MRYQYECKKCKVYFEIDKKVAAYNNPETCPSCKEVADRVFSSIPAHFKGTGFYQTDYKNRGK